MIAVFSLYTSCIGSIDFDDIRLTSARPGENLSQEEIIKGKLLSTQARNEITDLVRIHMDLPHSTQIRYTLHMIKKFRWAATCYTGKDIYLCEVKIHIRA